jgi:hypothetical protein
MHAHVRRQLPGCCDVLPQVRLHIGLQHENIITLYAAWQEAGNVVLVQVGV